MNRIFAYILLTLSSISLYSQVVVEQEVSQVDLLIGEQVMLKTTVLVDADKDVKIYREEIYYQIKLANLVGKNTDISSVDSVSDLLKQENVYSKKNVCA